jgi:hypothetical protein
VPAFQPVVSSPPPSEPDLRVSPHPALHEHIGWCRSCQRLLDALDRQLLLLAGGVDPVSWTLDRLARQGRAGRMSRCRETRPPYPPEFRRQAVELLRSGTPLKRVAVELGVSEQALRNWRRRAAADGGRAEGLTTEEREELRRRRLPWTKGNGPLRTVR